MRQEIADLVTFTEEVFNILNRELHFCALYVSYNDLVYAYLKFYNQNLFIHVWVMIKLICTRSYSEV